MVLSLLVAVQLYAPTADAQDGYGLGRLATAEEIAAMDTDVRFDGQDLPEGLGTYEDGRALYEAQCSSCHGRDLAGVPDVAPAVAGPGRTIESYWPYAPTVFDYIRRSMPANAPRSLTDSEVYALVAYLLGDAGIHPKDEPMDRTALKAVEMPNREGFVPDSRPDVRPPER